MSILEINESTCRTCRICVQSCPVSIIEGGSNGVIPFISPEKEPICIHCGHCEAVCPEDALVHGLTLQALEVAQVTESIFSPAEVGSYFKNRRSIRAYHAKSIEKKVMEQMMDVVRYAPTGTNRQLNQWVVISQPEMVTKLASATIDLMRAMVKSQSELAGKYNLQTLIDAFEKGNDRICRNAPCIVIGYAPATYPLGAKDVVIAASHLELLAPAYGLGACWAGFLMIALQTSPDIKKLVGLDQDSMVHAALMLGYPKFSYKKVPERKPAVISWL